MWGWDQSLNNWSDQQKSLLRASWRPSTLKAYKPAWTRWISWARMNKIPEYKPSGSDLARFLADLHNQEGLSYNTILSYKSAVSTLCDPEATETLSSHPLVKRILKSIAITKPKISKPPVWDVDLVINYLSRLNPDTNRLYEISKCTASILLLCSGRRVHDLTLLRTNPSNCIICNDHIILVPAFGSKTDSADYRQSGWKLKHNPCNKSLSPVHWIKRLIEAGQQRRQDADCDNLFVSTCGQAKPATRCVIAGWVKNMLKESGVEASAGSFRAAVASKSWIENSPLEEILTRGNWRSAKTFKRFYCRQISSVNNSNNISQLFSAVD